MYGRGVLSDGFAICHDLWFECSSLSARDVFEHGLVICVGLLANHLPDVACLLRVYQIELLLLFDLVWEHERLLLSVREKWHPIVKRLHPILQEALLVHGRQEGHFLLHRREFE